MTASRAVVVRAHAKINVQLDVLGSRPDGYHELRTIFQSLDLHDTVTCARTRGPFRFQCSASDVPHDSSNLVWRAASALSEIVRGDAEPYGVTIVLSKQIPVGGGLGGGSSDAAATLAALSRLWNAKIDQTVLRDLASRIGADVPYFQIGGTALGLGRGDDVYPLPDLAGSWIVLVTPPFAVLTKDAYAWFDADATHADRQGARMLRTADGLLVVPVRNDLEPSVDRRHPVIRAIRDVLERSGAVGAAMSGSGSTVFGMFRNRTDAVRACRSAARYGWQASLTRTLRRDQYRRRALPRILTVRLPPPAAIG